ncbi:hypothetical protein LWI29_036367 [Acer saccharum]|uniref:Lipid desaturase domain-containing protein n=1 Tax=Acer saccharum TaxID=4024 RepID=A0AA39W640_ACESA|nr:hypothetical protein LWI29_036367 [Acer saccharum]
MANQEILPASTTSPPLLNDPSVLSSWSHRLWVASGCTMVLISLAKSIVASAHSHTWIGPTLAGCVGYILADLFSGFYHWAIDNYGDASTPFFGPQIKGFQGDHKEPLVITKHIFANNLHDLARATTFIVLPVNILCNDPIVHGFVSVCLGCLMFSQQFHVWAHCPKSKLPWLVVALQDAGVLLSWTQHAAHHRPPYNKNYCIFSGVWNKFMDDNKVFEVLERFLSFEFGIRPRSWNEYPVSKRTKFY